MLVETGRAQPHHVLPETGWVSHQIRNDDDVAEVIELFRLALRAGARRGERRRRQQPSSSAKRSAPTLPPREITPTRPRLTTAPDEQRGDADGAARLEHELQPLEREAHRLDDLARR